jgi:hypothetical protein
MFLVDALLQPQIVSANHCNIAILLTPNFYDTGWIVSNFLEVIILSVSILVDITIIRVNHVTVA